MSERGALGHRRKRARVYLLELTCSPGLGFSLASAYLEAYARYARGLDSDFEFRRGLAYTGLGPDGVAAAIDRILERGGDPAVLVFTVYFWNREATLREIRRLKWRWPDVVVLVGGNDVEESLATVPEIDAVGLGEGERVFADILGALSAGGREGLTSVPGAAVGAEGRGVVVKAQTRIEDVNEIPSPFLTGVISPEEISKASMVVMETNRGCPFACAFCYWGGAVNSRVRRFSPDRLRREIETVVAAMRPGATLFLADANFGMHAQDLEFTHVLVDALARADKKILIFVNWAKNTTHRVVEAAEAMFRGGLIGSVTLSAQSLDPAALEACQRQNIPFAQYERLQVEFAERGIPTYTELLLGLPPESAEEFRNGLDRVLASGGHPVVYPLLLLNNTKFATPEMRARWGLNVRRLPYQPNDPDATVDTVTGHARLDEGEWLELMDLVLTMGLFLHALAGETIREASRLAGCGQVEGLTRVLKAVREGRIGWPASAQALFDNYRQAAFDPGLYSQTTIAAVLGEDAIPDHLHYQAILHVTAAWLSQREANADALLTDVAAAVLGRLPTPAEAAACVGAQRARLEALTVLIAGAAPALVQGLEAFRDMPIDALLLGIYHGAVRLPSERSAEAAHV